MKALLPLLLFACGAIFQTAALAQDTPPPVEMNAAEKAFQQSMNNVTLVGFFTVGDSTELHDDKYVIDSVAKVKDGVWKFVAHVLYQKKDMKVTLNVPVMFAGETPVISLTRQAVTGFGTFDTRLVVYKGGYAGTWGGGDHGGKMFGNIVKNESAEASK
jgi:hypothetical protein